MVRGTRALCVVGILLAFSTTSCDKLGGKKDETSSDSKDKDDDDDSSSKSKKKKKKKKDDDDSDDEDKAKPSATASAAPVAPPTPTPTPSDTAAPQDTGDVKRYPDETPDKGNLSISSAVAARKEANRTSELVLTLQPGSQVQRVARYTTYTLVSWTNKSGTHYGWVETNKAFKDITFDGGAPKEIEGLGQTKFDAGPKIDAGKK